MGFFRDNWWSFTKVWKELPFGPKNDNPSSRQKMKLFYHVFVGQKGDILGRWEFNTFHVDQVRYCLLCTF